MAATAQVISRSVVGGHACSLHVTSTIYVLLSATAMLPTAIKRKGGGGRSELGGGGGGGESGVGWGVGVMVVGGGGVG